MKVLTWNIHSFVGRDGVGDADRIINAISRQNPTITLLQEIDFRILEPKLLDSLRQSTGKNAVSAPALGDGDRWYGQILISDLPIEKQTVHDLSVPGREPRRLIEAVVETPDGPLRVMGTHLGLNRRERRRQFSQISEIAGKASHLPTVLMGDLNEWLPARKLSRRLLGKDSASTPVSLGTFPSHFPMFPLDRVMTSPARLLREYAVITDDREASDHLALTAGLNLG